MGYRSDVVVVIYPEPQPDAAKEQEMYDQLKVLMATQFKDVVDAHFGENMSWNDADRVLKFEMLDVKWYDSYADVQAFTGMLQQFNAFDDTDIAGYCTEFVRIGEDYDDVELNRTGDNCHYYLSVNREVVCDV